MDEDASRRELLGTLGASLALGIGGSLAVPTQPRSALSLADETGVEPATVGESDGDAPSRTETPYGHWQYQPESEGMEPTSPVNVVFPLANATVGDVVAVFEDAGWYRRPLEYARYGYDRATEQYELQGWTGAETKVGVGGRLHVRTFALDGTLSVQAHVDSTATPKHEVPSYADAERATVALFLDAGWHRADPLFLGNDAPPDHDGSVSVLRWER